MLYPMMGREEQIITYFRIEPRTEYGTSHSYLVVYDKRTKKYLREHGSRHFCRFLNSDDIYYYLISLLNQEDMNHGT